MQSMTEISGRPRQRTRSLVDITREIDELRALPSRELARKYEALFGAPTRSNNREYLLRQIAWRLQDDAGHFEAIRARVEKLAPSVEVPVRWQQKAARAEGLPIVEPKESRPPGATAGTDPTKAKVGRDPRLPPPGTVLERLHDGRSHSIVVLDDAFEYAGERFATLTEIARAITGAKWNGFEFFKKPLAAARKEAAS
jgi:Protein of unknown function (DUF2924)